MKAFARDPDGIEAMHHYQLTPELEEGRELCLEAKLDELDLPHQTKDEIIKVTQRAAEVMSFHRTAEAIRWIAEKLGRHSTAGAAIVSVLGLADDTPMSEFAERFKVSKQAIGNRVADLKPLFASSLQKHGHDERRPTEPGDWLSIAEAREATGIKGDRIAAIARHYGVREARAGQRVFWDRAEIIRAVELSKQRRLMENYLPTTEL